MSVTIAGEQSHAPPLQGLKKRDDRALSVLFDRDDIDEIADDVTETLFRFYPEPIWEEDPFEFLSEFL